MAVQIRTARPDDLAKLSKLLTDNNLPISDLPVDLQNFQLAFDAKNLIGSIGFEKFEKTGLLRSVCVDSKHRNQGIAHELYNVAIREARQQSITDLYLITTTAHGYFKRLGFTSVERNEVPEAIQQTSQFSSLCPSSAITMKQLL